MSPADIRTMIRDGQLTGPTAGHALGYAQANLAILKKEHAFDFLLFAQRNPKACPILDVIEPGDFAPNGISSGADIRTDLPKYRIYKQGELVDEVTDILDYWSDDLVCFLIGCSFSFENALLNNDIDVRHITERCNVPMFKTNIATTPAGMFEGPTVVSMRPILEKDIVRAVQVTSRFPSVHGAPLHIGNPQAIGIDDISKPDFGDSVTIHDGEVPVFWACGVTPQAIAMHVKPELMITHAPGHMFITDIRDEHFGII
ncbi:putative hydro-lyase [Kurthia sibirica]|uniref:Putative hydro-lyase DEX24_02225 n=1 Tax=Kurthia sibirica TaxID=202750 RepID=A0A2U3AQ83_9BACL|nr:putative hydro-lyase [Kurthia sibirica]